MKTLAQSSRVKADILSTLSSKYSPQELLIAHGLPDERLEKIVVLILQPNNTLENSAEGLTGLTLSGILVLSAV